MISIYSGAQPKIIGATVYALNKTHGLAPAREAGEPEIVTEVIDDYSGLIRTDADNVYANGEFGILRFAEAEASPMGDASSHVPGEVPPSSPGAHSESRGLGSSTGDLGRAGRGTVGTDAPTAPKRNRLRDAIAQEIDESHLNALSALDRRDGVGSGR